MAIPVNKSDAALQVGSALLQPTLDIAGQALKKWFVDKDPIQRGADLLGNIGETTRAKVLGGLVDRESFSAPAVDIAKYKEENFKPSGKHAYPDMSKKSRERQVYKDAVGGVIPDIYYAKDRKLGTDYIDSTFEDNYIEGYTDQDGTPSIGKPGGMGEEIIAGRKFKVTPSQAGAFEAGPVETLIPNEFARSIGINDLERAKYASELAGWGASSAALGAAALGMNALMRGNKPRSAYSAPVQPSGGYNPNVESSMVSYENSLKLLEAKQRHWREKEMARQQAFTPGVQQYDSPPMGGYGHYSNNPRDAYNIATSIVTAQTPIYQ